jgi:hypothetical protein
MHESDSKPILTIHPAREAMITAAIVIGGSLMVAGSIYAVVLQPGGPEELGTVWPLYLGGIIAILLGWMNGDLQR